MRPSVTASTQPSVFINCPYDGKYQSRFDAVVFATVCCGFTPRSAIDRMDSRQRMDRIAHAMLASPYSIHDLSLCRGEGNENLARFNMPLELGIAIGFQLTQPGRHEWLALVPEGVEYEHYISDLSAYDPLRYDGTPEQIVSKVVLWLYHRKGYAAFRTLTQIKDLLPTLNAGMEHLRREWDGQAPWLEMTKLAVTIATP